ncbi:MAG: hypothetical protein M3373_06100 [Gemmatimonadota bacterium]|nr:hypothetical protein [Gemmatimonadota bacterium]
MNGKAIVVVVAVTSVGCLAANLQAAVPLAVADPQVAELQAFCTVVPESATTLPVTFICKIA